MISALIIVFSIGSLIQFFIAYCRSLVLAYGKVELSAKTREVAAIANDIPADEFKRLLLLARMYPDPGDDHVEIRAVSAYYSLLSVLHTLLNAIRRQSDGWTGRERAACAYFAAVTLDRRIAYHSE
jgi:hypothetical protein